ncbi:hypothetical protein Tco_1178676 [Tanacetum coccineum]
MKGTCKSLTELEYFCEEVYKATTEKLDWINPEGRQYPHDLRQPLPLVPNSQGRHVIPFHHFINNDLEYLRGGVSSRKYSTSVTKTTAADYGHIKWIEDLFYAFATSRESARDVYSKRRIIAVTKVEIVEWQNYKHLDWITVRRDDDVLYKFKEGDFHRLRIQDIEDMLLLLVQRKILERVNYVLRISGLYTLRLLDAACKKVLNLLKKGLLKVKATLKSAWTEKDQIDNLLKEKRLMRSLEKFVGGKLYEGDLRLRQKNHMILSYDVLINQFDKWNMLEYDESNTYVLERFNTTVGNPVKKILLIDSILITGRSSQIRKVSQQTWAN